MTRTSREACFEQIKGFGSYGFPESHAASFALLVYVSAWIKKHHPAAFAAALLNSQPMGFYAPAEIVRCAREHGKVTVLAPDAAFSHWDCTLERDTQGRAVPRLGLRQIDGFKRGRCPHHHATNAAMAIATLPTSCAAPRLSKRALVTLAEADAFRGFGLDRREGLWAVRRLPDDDPLPLVRATRRAGTGRRTDRASARDAAQRTCAGRLPDHAPVAERPIPPSSCGPASTPKALRPARAWAR